MGFMQSAKYGALWTALQKEFPPLRKMKLTAAEIEPLLKLVEADRAANRRARIPAEWRQNSIRNLVDTYIEEIKTRRILPEVLDMKRLGKKKVLAEVEAEIRQYAPEEFEKKLAQDIGDPEAKKSPMQKGLETLIEQQERKRNDRHR